MYTIVNNSTPPPCPSPLYHVSARLIVCVVDAWLSRPHSSRERRSTCPTAVRACKARHLVSVFRFPTSRPPSFDMTIPQGTRFVRIYARREEYFPRTSSLSTGAQSRTPRFQRCCSVSTPSRVAQLAAQGEVAPLGPSFELASLVDPGSVVLSRVREVVFVSGAGCNVLPAGALS
ncbi:hypothetical protein BD414DRAFT_491359 [Trametes punicea]|nr:hypothetical protein BD414DRAFT_491359 [Trametes punicea]